LINIFISNVVTQYGDQLKYIAPKRKYKKNKYKIDNNQSVAFANIAVHYILQPITSVLNEAERFRRFIDG